MCFQKLSISPPRKGFFLRPPPPSHLSENTSPRFTHLLKFLGLRDPPNPQEFPIYLFLLWGDHGYFPELHISISSSLGYDNKRRKLILSTPGTWMLKKSYFFPKWGKLNVQSKRNCLSGLASKHMNEFDIGPWVRNIFTCINITLGVKVIQYYKIKKVTELKHKTLNKKSSLYI